MYCDVLYGGRYQCKSVRLIYVVDTLRRLVLAGDVMASGRLARGISLGIMKEEILSTRLDLPRVLLVLNQPALGAGS